MTETIRGGMACPHPERVFTFLKGDPSLICFDCFQRLPPPVSKQGTFFGRKTYEFYNNHKVSSHGRYHKSLHRMMAKRAQLTHALTELCDLFEPPLGEVDVEHLEYISNHDLDHLTRGIKDERVRKIYEEVQKEDSYDEQPSFDEQEALDAAYERNLQEPNVRDQVIMMKIGKLDASAYKAKVGKERKKPKAKGVVQTLISHTEPKYLDNTVLATSVGAGGTIYGLSSVPQGDTQSTRVGDFIQPRALIINWDLYTVNSDIVTTIRLVVFRWVPSNALIAPVIADILENAAAANVLAHFNFQYQDNYVVMKDMQFQASGVVTAPTVNSNFGKTGMRIPNRGSTEIEFGLGTNTGSNHIYLLLISDSALTPFPIFNFVSRLYYEDTIKAGSPSKMVK